MNGSITNNYSSCQVVGTDFVDDLKQKRIEKRVLAYVTKIIKDKGSCFMSQERIRLAIFNKKTGKGFRKQAIVDALRSLTANGKLVKIEVENKNRKNKKPIYFLPDVELSGNSSKSSFFYEHTFHKAENLKIEKNIIPNPKEGKEEGRDEVNNFLRPNFFEVGTWQNLSRLELIEKYLDAGLMVTPLIPNGKIPPATWDKEKLRTKSKKELLDDFEANPQWNVGCWVSENFVVVDADDLEKFSELTGGEIWETLTVKSGRENGGLHYWFSHGGTIGSGVKIRPDLDYKSSRSLIVLPPSVHASGKQYTWQTLVAPIVAPQVIQNLYDTRPKKEAVADAEVEVKKVKKGKSASLRDDVVLNEKQRYDALFAEGRRVRHWMDAEQVENELHRLNKLHCQPMLDAKRMNKLVTDVLNGANRRDYATKKAERIKQATTF